MVEAVEAESSCTEGLERGERDSSGSERPLNAPLNAMRLLGGLEGTDLMVPGPGTVGEEEWPGGMGRPWCPAGAEGLVGFTPFSLRSLSFWELTQRRDERLCTRWWSIVSWKPSMSVGEETFWVKSST